MGENLEMFGDKDILGIGTIIGATWGARLSLKTRPSVIKKIIALCLFLLALRLFMDVL